MRPGIMKQFNQFALIPFIMMVLVSGVAVAKQPAPTYAEFEVPKLVMKLSNNGSGIIRNVTCGGCTFKFALITRNTAAYVNGVKVDVLRARERAGKPVFIQFIRETGEVMAIRWME